MLPKAEAKALSAARISIFRQWSQELLDKPDADGSLKVLARAYTLAPTDAEVVAGIAYHTQQALAALEKTSASAMADHYAAVAKQFPKVDAVAEAGKAHAARALDKLADDKKFKEALAAVGTYRPLLAKSGHEAEVAEMVYDRWARSLTADEKWADALAKYKEGIKAYPTGKLLRNNAVAVVDEWAEAATKKRDWDAAIAVYKTGLDVLGNEEHLQGNKAYCERMKEKK
ncbi:hypothetical protein [Limnoglobus roseus]|uniref:Tetratricopeptide repeat protein n=1 Tax=Limnoglobus roseus TaxID=2598579 RepID=A0A5C1AK69_9BACT|nr:hypothetical protein [Limnoglobus roseus]QEL18567.1 hypothetical protein PX52LOC_05599 [Limnoglobus roseus]